MASFFSHAVAAIAIGKTASRERIGTKALVTGMACAGIPDLDAVGFWTGVPYDSLWGHRGITHSFFFALLLALAVMKWMFPAVKAGSRAWWTHFVFFFLATASHPVLDAMTNGGLGVAFFAPFDDTRYFLPYRPVRVSPISITRFFSDYGWQVFKSELQWIWLPSALWMLAMAGVRRWQKGR